MYFNTNRPTEEQIFNIQSILDAGDKLGLILSMKQVQNADGKWRTAYVGISEKRINEGYAVLELDNQE